ncbi:MAG: TetR/AcrR family transcriptional regulator [Nannocystis sp.]|nr:TetR/AcrR family transcriptional regulator [Nannocystis sp.]
MAEDEQTSGRAGDDEGGGDGRSARALQRREQRRGEIIAAATRVFKEKGYHAASISDIIDAAGVARGTFYLYFTSKREIFTELTTEFLAIIRGSVRKISLDPGAEPPIDQMRANFRRVMSSVIQHDDLATIMLREPGDLDAESRALLDQFFNQVVDLIELAVRVGRGLGFARACDDRLIAISALGALREVLRRILAARDPTAGAAAAEWSDTERLADELVTFFVRGVFT